MATDHIRYDILAQEALRGVVRTVLADVAEKGLLGEHHFKIAFDTQDPGVRLSSRLREQYPEEMTIILQHQFWDLTVTDDAFEVGLSFGGIPERLRVPFEAITGFFDPSVDFGLQFATVIEDEESEETSDPAENDTAGERPPAKRKLTPIQTSASVTPLHPSAGDEPEDEPDKPGGGGEVVRLDRFRKK